ncbi:MAG: hypothetical protein IPG12_01355 [Saprospiraceae bacterium]|nr:hypothetical protein [Saprospiraceae bacterium]
MKPVFLIIFGILWNVSIFAQSRSFGTIPMIQAPKSKSRINVNGEIDPYKKQKALEIFNKLRDARGDFRYPVPTFEMTKDVGMVASMDYNKLQINLEEKAYNVCATFADTNAAIAFLLAHELSHYYEKHAWKRGFVSEFKDLAIGLKLDSLQDDVANETEADYLGGFLAYSAGYGFFDQGSAIIKALYKAYGLGNKLPKYPSLQDRQAMSVRTTEKLRRLIQVFDMSNLLIAVGNYSEANEYLKYILMEYQSRELYNNYGVSILSDVMTNYFNANELRFRYPIHLDLESSAKDAGIGNVRQLLIKQAILQFDAAISMDPNYLPAYINKACAYALLGDPVRGEFYADVEARKIAEQNKDQKAIQDLTILIGIIKANKGDTLKAKELFETAKMAGSKLAGINLKILNREPLGDETESGGSRSKPEQIDNTSLKSLILANEFTNPKSLQISNTIKFIFVPAQGPSSFLFISEQGDKSTYFHCTKPGYKLATAKKIAIGMNSDAITSPTAYGNPKNTIETPNGRILIYKSILFIIGKDDKLERWVVFSK